jgi:hypothetical protein
MTWLRFSNSDDTAMAKLVVGLGQWGNARTTMLHGLSRRCSDAIGAGALIEGSHSRFSGLLAFGFGIRAQLIRLIGALPWQAQVIAPEVTVSGRLCVDGPAEL